MKMFNDRSPIVLVLAVVLAGAIVWASRFGDHAVLVQTRLASAVGIGFLSQWHDRMLWTLRATLPRIFHRMREGVPRTGLSQLLELISVALILYTFAHLFAG